MDLRELRDPHDEAVLRVAGLAAEVRVGGGRARAPQHDPGRGLRQVLVLGEVLRPVGQEAVAVLQHRLHHPDTSYTALVTVPHVHCHVSRVFFGCLLVIILVIISSLVVFTSFHSSLQEKMYL